jgi:AcrR family transcriptional regulator
MEDVAAEAAVGKGTIYRYFSDKEELFQALVARASQQYLLRLRESTHGPGSARDRLRRMVQGVLDFFDEQPHLFDLLQRAEVLHRVFPWKEVRSEAIQITRGLLEEGAADGEWSVATPELTTLLLLGGLRSVVRLGEKPRPPGLADAILTVFLRP